MAKGQQRSNREPKKAKLAKPKAAAPSAIQTPGKTKVTFGKRGLVTTRN